LRGSRRSRERPRRRQSPAVGAPQAHPARHPHLGGFADRAGFHAGWLVCAPGLSVEGGRTVLESEAPPRCGPRAGYVYSSGAPTAAVGAGRLQRGTVFAGRGRATSGFRPALGRRTAPLRSRPPCPSLPRAGRGALPQDQRGGFSERIASRQSVTFGKAVGSSQLRSTVKPSIVFDPILSS
jgi:hypothetical protein